MKDDTLANLLTRADAPPPPSRATAVDLAHAVRSTSVRRSTIRRVGAICITAGVCALATLLVSHPLHRDSNQTSPIANVAQLKAEVALLDAQARYHEKTARAVAQATEAVIRRAAIEKVAATDPFARIQEQREAAAAILVHQAAQLVNQPGKQDLARQEFQRAARLFSDTTSGRQAETFLRQGV